MRSAKLIAVGNSVGLVLSKDILEARNLKKGDEVFVSMDANGIHLTSHDPDFVEAMRLADESMAERASVYKALAE